MELLGTTLHDETGGLRHLPPSSVQVPERFGHHDPCVFGELVQNWVVGVLPTFIQPRYVGATVGLSAEMTFMSLVVWTFLLGPLGALLAVPMTLLVRALFIDPDERTAWVNAPVRDDGEWTRA